MSKNISSSISDTSISGVTAPSLTLPVLNYDADWRVTSRTDEAIILMNNKAAMDEEEQLVIKRSEIANIYANAGLAADSTPPIKRGYQLLVQLRKTVKVVDSTDTSNVLYLPITAHFVLKFPCNEVVTDAYIATTVARCIGGLYENGSLKALSMLKGAIDPKGI